MEELYLILLFVFVILVLPWILLIRSRRLRTRMSEDWEKRFAEQTGRIYQLEKSFDALRREVSERVAAGPAQASATVAAPPEPHKTAPQAAPPAPPIPFPAAPIEKPPVRVVPAAPPVAASSTFVPTDLKAPAIETLPQPTLMDRVKKFDIEEVLGANWLIKIGIVLLVFGIAFFLSWQLKEMGPAGKVMVGFLVSAALLAGGIFLERKPGYRLLGRSGIGGGWALAFFVTYAMYHVAPAKVLTSEALDLFLMGVVAAGMVAHSLRYRSQLVTGMAFLLAFSTCTISQVTVYSLTAGVVLTAALVIIVYRLRWWELEIFGLIAAYLNHFVWLFRIIDPMGGHKHPFPEFYPSAAILVAYWAMFRASYVLRKIEDPDDERIATAAALLNSFGLLSLLKYQSVHPELAFWALLALGTVETLLSLYARRHRRLAFAVLASIGIALLFAAVPFRFAMMNVSIVWIAGVEALLAVGIFTREIVFRRLSFVAAGAAIAQMLSVDVARVIGMRMDDAMPGRIVALGVAILFASAMLYFNASYARRRWSELLDADSSSLRLISYGAAALAISGLWVMFPNLETAPAWAIGAVVLGTLAWRMQDFEIRNDLKLQADVLALFALFRAISFNFESSATWTSHHISQRLVTVALCALAMYVASRNKAGYEFGDKIHVPDIYTWVASFLVGTLLWYELHSVSVACAWALFGLILLEAGLMRRSLHLRLQSYVALLSAFIRIFTANLAADSTPGELSPRIYSTLPVIFILSYAYWRLADDTSDDTSHDRRFYVPQVCSWMSLAGFAAVIRFEVQSDWVAVAWAAFVPVLLALAIRTGRHLFTAQALFMVLIATFRAGLHNLYERSIIPGPILFSRIVCVGSVCALLFLSLPLGYRLLGKYAEPPQDAGKFRRGYASVLRRPEQMLFFAPYLLVIGLLWAEMSKGMLTLSWSVFGVIAFLFGLWLGERSFRLAGMALLMAGVGKIVVVDVWTLSTRDKALTFVVAGAAMVTVSILFTRHREAIRRLL